MQSLGPLAGLTCENLLLTGPSVGTIRRRVSRHRGPLGESKRGRFQGCLIQEVSSCTKIICCKISEMLLSKSVLIPCCFSPSQFSLQRPGHVPLSREATLASPQPGSSARAQVPCQRPSDEWEAGGSPSAFTPVWVSLTNGSGPSSLPQLGSAGSSRASSRMQDAGPTLGGSARGRVGRWTREYSGHLKGCKPAEGPPFCIRLSWAEGCLGSQRGTHPAPGGSSKDTCEKGQPSDRGQVSTVCSPPQGRCRELRQGRQQLQLWLGVGAGAAVQRERLSNPHFLQADLADEREVTLGTAWQQLISALRAGCIGLLTVM